MAAWERAILLPLIGTLNLFADFVGGYVCCTFPQTARSYCLNWLPLSLSSSCLQAATRTKNRITNPPS